MFLKPENIGKVLTIATNQTVFKIYLTSDLAKRNQPMYSGKIV